MDETLKLLMAVYDSSSLASKTIGKALPYVDNVSLRKNMISQINDYDNINIKAGREISELGKKPRVSHPMKEKLQSWSVGMSVGSNERISNVAKVITGFANNRAVDITSEMNTCINSSPTAYNLARQLVARDELSAKSLKPYL